MNVDEPLLSIFFKFKTLINRKGVNGGYFS